MRNIRQADIPAWQAHGFVLSAQEGTAVLDLPSDYDQYLNSLSGKNRSELRRNRRRATEQQVRLQQGSLHEDGTLVYPLFREVFARHSETIPFTAEFFATIAREMPGQALLFKGFVGGELAGASLYLTNGPRAWWPLVGLNYELAYPSYLYFLLLDEMIQWSIQHGVKRFYGGTTKEREKQKHGFTVQERWFGYHASPSALNRLLRFTLPAAQKFLK
jgi:predicted N-acyltransferase